MTLISYQQIKGEYVVVIFARVTDKMSEFGIARSLQSCASVKQYTIAVKLDGNLRVAPRFLN